MNRPSSRPLALCATSMRAGQRLLRGRSARPTPAITSLLLLMPSSSTRSPSAGATKTGLRTARSADSSPVLPLPEWDQCPIDHEKDSGHLAEAVPGPKLTSEPNAYIRRHAPSRGSDDDHQRLDIVDGNRTCRPGGGGAGTVARRRPAAAGAERHSAGFRTG